MFKNKQLVITASVILTLVAVGANPAYSTNFSLSFLNDSGQQVGSGQFSFDENSPGTCVSNNGPFPPPGGCQSPFGHLIPNVINSISVNVSGVTISDFAKETPLNWWASGSTQQVGAYYADKSTFYIIDKEWNLAIRENYINSRPNTALNLSFNPVSDTLGTGTWSGYTTKPLPLFPGDPTGITTSLGSGTFIATALPEPLNILGCMTVLGLGVVLKRKLS